MSLKILQEDGKRQKKVQAKSSQPRSIQTPNGSGNGNSEHYVACKIEPQPDIAKSPVCTNKRRVAETSTGGNEKEFFKHGHAIR